MKLKMLLSTVAAAAAVAIAFPASAAPTYPVFTVTPGAGEAGTAGASFQANDLGGGYNEAISFKAGNLFDVSLLFIGGQFFLDDPLSPVTYSAGQSGLGANYGLYSTFLGTGSYTTSGTSTTFTLTGGNFDLYLDKNNNSGSGVGGITAPGNGTTLYALNNTGDDILLGSGSNAFGVGTSTCTGGNNCGSFGQTVNFALTSPAGTNFFTAPVPFYSMILTSGQFQGINPVIGGTQYSSGTANSVFNVPEPSPLALLGLGLVALGFSRRRSGKAKA